jgi:hypothetical protein
VNMLTAGLGALHRACLNGLLYTLCLHHSAALCAHEGWTHRHAVDATADSHEWFPVGTGGLLCQHGSTDKLVSSNAGTAVVSVCCKKQWMAPQRAWKHGTFRSCNGVLKLTLACEVPDFCPKLPLRYR